MGLLFVNCLRRADAIRRPIDGGGLAWRAVERSGGDGAVVGGDIG